MDNSHPGNYTQCPHYDGRLIERVATLERVVLGNPGKADGMATQDRKRHGNIPQRHLRPPHLFFSIHTPPARNFHCGTPISFLDLR